MTRLVGGNVMPFRAAALLSFQFLILITFIVRSCFFIFQCDYFISSIKPAVQLRYYSKK